MDTRISVGGSDFYRNEIITPNQFSDELYQWLVLGKSFSDKFSCDSDGYIYHYQITRADSYNIVVSRNMGTQDDLVFSGPVATFINNYKVFGRSEAYIMLYRGRMMTVFQGIYAVKDDLNRYFDGEMSLQQIKGHLDVFLSCYLALRDERAFHGLEINDDALGGKATALLIELLGLISLKKPPLSLLSSIASQILFSES